MSNGEPLGNLLTELKELREENKRIKDGKGWFEDTPSGSRKHYFCNEEEELKQASIQIADLTTQVQDLSIKWNGALYGEQQNFEEIVRLRAKLAELKQGEV